MSPEDLVASQADPQPALPFVCPHCGTSYRGPISVAMCCDSISFELGYD